MDAAVNDPSSTPASEPSDCEAAIRVTGMYSNSDDVARVHAARIKRFQSLIGDDRVAVSAAAAAFTAATPLRPRGRCVTAHKMRTHITKWSAA